MEDKGQIDGGEEVLIGQEAPEVEDNSHDEAPVAPLSLREQLKEASKGTKEEAPEIDKEQKPRDRAPDGKFAKKQDGQQPSLQAKVDTEPKAAVEKIAPPESYSAAVKAQWDKLPQDIQRELNKREQDFHKELTRHDEERTTGRQFRQLVTPYAAQMRAEGAEPLQAVQALLNTAYVLRAGTQAQKVQLLRETARQFGVDLTQATQAQPQVHPVLQQLQQKQEQLERQIQLKEAQEKQQEQAGLKSQIETFAAQPGHEHFEAVKAHMAALLQNELAKDLQDAYDQAVYARPDIRSTLLSQQSADLEAKRVADKKAKAEAAKRAGSSIRGGPGMVAEKNGKIAHSTLRDSITASFREHVDG